MSKTIALPTAVADQLQARVRAEAASLFADYPVARVLRRLAARDIERLAEKWGDEADDALIDGKSRRAAYLDRWKLALLNGLGGPFDSRLGGAA